MVERRGREGRGKGRCGAAVQTRPQPWVPGRRSKQKWPSGPGRRARSSCWAAGCLPAADAPCCPESLSFCSHVSTHQGPHLHLLVPPLTSPLPTSVQLAKSFPIAREFQYLLRLGLPLLPHRAEDQAGPKLCPWGELSLSLEQPERGCRVAAVLPWLGWTHP